jgi:2-dehydro-3-deoxygluconokinase
MNNSGDDVAAAISEALGGPEPRDLRVVTFGEATVRLTVPRKERLERATSLDVSAGGPELNTSVALASFGVPATWVSALPDSSLGRLILREARSYGVDTSAVSLAPASTARTGLTFVEEGPDPRPSSVQYDVAATAFSGVKPGTFDWERVLEGASAFHVSGITLGLSAGARSEAMEAVRVANQLGVLVSFDLLYRAESWSEADARQAFVRLIHDVDVLFTSRGGLRTFFGIEGSYESVLRQAIEKIGVAAVTVNRKRAKGSRRMNLTSMAMGKTGALAVSEGREIEVVDRLGAGDAFAAGFLAGYLENPLALTRAVSLGAAASALKHTIPGEFLCVSREEIEALAQGQDSGT